MIKPLMNSNTNKEVMSFISSPANCLVLIARNGSGKKTIADYLISELISPDQKLFEGRDIMHIQPIEGNISVETVREISKFFNLKPLKGNGFTRALIIEHSEKLSREAQNSLLKTIEEPPANTLIILTLDSKQSLLPTLHSRLTSIYIDKIDQSSINNHFVSSGYDLESIKLALLVSDNKIGMATDILSNESNTSLETLKICKEIIGMNKTQRLVKINDFAKDKQKIRDLIDGIINIAKASLEFSATRNPKPSEAWSRALSASIEAKEAILANASPKLVLTKLFLAI